MYIITYVWCNNRITPSFLSSIFHPLTPSPSPALATSPFLTSPLLSSTSSKCHIHSHDCANFYYQKEPDKIDELDNSPKANRKDSKKWLYDSSLHDQGGQVHSKKLLTEHQNDYANMKVIHIANTLVIYQKGLPISDP